MNTLSKIAYIASAEAMNRDQKIAKSRASLTAADAFRASGLWPAGRPAALYRVEAPGEVEARERGVFADWVVVERMDAREALEELSVSFVDFEDEIYEEQALWRRALDRPRDDAALVESHLEQAIRARGLKHWTLKRVPERTLRNTSFHPQSMYSWSSMAAILAWEAWEAESEDHVYARAREEGWKLWYQSKSWSDFDFKEPPDFGEVAQECWDAWVALTVFYASSAGFVDIVAETYTVGLRTAYLYGLALARPIDRGVLGWSMT